MDRDFLDSFNKQTDNIDNEILILLKRRFQIGKKIVKYKLDKKMELYDISRDDEIIKRISSQAIVMTLSQSFVRNLFQSILNETKIEQDNFIAKKLSRLKKK